MTVTPGEKLPDSDRAVVPRAKLEDYLLSNTHVVGKAKARFFQALGFTIADPSRLEQALKTIAQQGQVVAVTATAFGVKYEVQGQLVEQGRAVSLTTIWIVEKGSSYPRFVTAYPTKGR